MFFLASMGISQAHEQAVMNYWWVRPEAAPAHAASVVRVLGEKGERFEDVYTLDRLESSPVVMQARLQRQEMLRREAMALVKKLKAEGKSPVVAYEEAWTQVYKNRWLTANWQLGSSKLEDMLLRMSAENQSELTAEEQQWVLEALLENDDRLETKAGRELLRRLTQRLRALGYGSLYTPNAANDQVMKRFADALSTGMDSMAAYREAMFTTHRDRVGQHSLRGYVAPWGIRVGGPRYHQAPQKVGVTEGSASGLDGALAANPQPGNQHTAPGLNDVSSAEKDFLAVSPELTDEDEAEKQTQEEEETEQKDDTGIFSAPAPRMMMASSYAARSVAATAAASSGITDSQLNTLVNAANLTVAENKNASVHVDGSPSSYNDAKWNNNAWSGSNIKSTTAKKITSVAVNTNSHLYLGKSNNVSVVVNNATNSYLHAEEEKSRRPVAGYGLFTYNKLQGKGAITLMGDAANKTTIYAFSGEPGEDEGFCGTIRMAGSVNTSRVQLNLSGNHWKNAVVDLSLGSGTAYNNAVGTVSKTILNITGNTELLGLNGGSASATTLTSASGDYSYTLTLGDDSDTTYQYDGGFHGSYYTSDTSSKSSSAPLNLTKVYSNTQKMTADATGNSAFNEVVVQGGTLEFSQSLQAVTAWATGGRLEIGGNLTITEAFASKDELYVSGDGSAIAVAGNISVKDDVRVQDWGSLSAANLTVRDKVSVSGGGSIKISGDMTAQALSIYGGSVTTHNLQDASNHKLIVEVGEGKDFASTLTVTGNLEADTLRLRNDGVLVTGLASNTISESHIHGGATWQMEGTQNIMSGLMKIEDAEGGITLTSESKSAILTLPGTISFADAGWTDSNVAVFTLDGVTLDFSRGVTLTNLGFAFNDESSFVLATITDNGGGFTETSSSVMVESGGVIYHANLHLVDSTIVVSMLHDLGHHSYEVADGSVVYIEMKHDAQDPALPYHAIPVASWSGNWSGDALENLPADEEGVTGLDKLMGFASVTLRGGGAIYLGEDPAGDAADLHFGGKIKLDAEEKAASLHGQINSWGNWLFDGRLSGSGVLKLVAHHGIGERSLNPESVVENESITQVVTTKTYQYGTASTFTFTDTSTTWMSGTIGLAANAGTSDDAAAGIVQLNIGNVNIAGKGDTRWKNVVVDFSNPGYDDPDSVATTNNAQATELVLGVVGDATIAGLKGGTNASVVSDVPESSARSAPVLTIGTDGQNYTFSGTLGSGNFYTGGQASRKETTTNTYTVEGGDVVLSSSSTSVEETNVVRMGEGRLSLVKVGSNTQSFKGAAFLDSVEVQSGCLNFTGNTSMESLEVQSGATLLTSTVSVGSATLHGGATWLIGANTDLSNTPLTLVDMSGQTINLNASGGSFTWTTMQYVDFAGDSVYSSSTPWFTLDSGVTLDMSAALTLLNVQGIETGSKIALYGGVMTAPVFDDNQFVYVTDANGHEYESRYSYEGNIVYLNIGQKTSSGILVQNCYIWSGEKSGYTDAAENHLGLKMGNVWRADGSADQTGWHEQRVAGVASGVYQNGIGVSFDDIDVHQKSEDVREVYIYGKVAPGAIHVTANSNAGSMGSGDAELIYGYALTGHVDSANAGIIDYMDAAGNIIERTSITKTGDSVLILNTANDFTGGIEIKDGALYLSRPYSSGTGPISLYVDCEWKDYWDKSGSNSGFVTVDRVGAELMVNYEHNHDEVSAYRNPVVQNTVILKSGSGEQGKNGHATISYAHAAYESKSANDDFSNVPRHWRNLAITGGLYGDGDLELRGYTSCWDGGHDQCYVSAFTINHSQLDKELIDSLGMSSQLTSYTGKVTLTNAVNTSQLSNDNKSNRTAGGVQLSLSDDTFARAHIDLTREQVVWSSSETRQSYTNILVVNGDVSVGALSGDFLGKAWNYTRSGSGYSRAFGDISQKDERWRLRVVTGSDTTLRLGEEGDSSKYVYSGAMGYEQSYTQPQQAHISFDSFETLEDVKKYNTSFEGSGKFSNGTETLSLVKSGQSQQYIHTALLNDVSLYQGTLGFNYLNLKGNLNLVRGTNLNLGVTSEAGWQTVSGDSRGYNTSESVTINDYKTLTVISSQLKQGEVLQSAHVDGNIDMSGKSALTFLVYTTPDSLSTDVYTKDYLSEITPLLDVDGTLNLSSSQTITLSFDNVSFSLGQKYYIARADAICVDGKVETAFGTRTVTLGYGYFGTLYTVGDNGCSMDGNLDDVAVTGMSDYLVMTVTGDPRRTWSGMVGMNGHNYTWTTGTSISNIDYRWKENREFLNGQVVLFGNLNVPTLWTAEADLTSDQTVNVDKNNLQVGTPVETTGDKPLYTDGFGIDSYALDGQGYQAVKVDGKVAPFMVMINANYEEFSKEEGKEWVLSEAQKEDDTNYYFYTTDGLNGSICDATREELQDSGFDESWKTMVHKTGTGTTVMALDNSYTGGTLLQGGTMVMQHVNALGGVYDAVNDCLTGNDCTITLMNGASLQGDFNDDDYPGNYHEEGNLSLGKAMATTTINNKVVVNVYVDPNDASYNTLVDGRLVNSGNKKLIISQLEGESDTVLLLTGVSLTREEAAKRSIERYAAKDDETGEFLMDANRNYLARSGEILELDRYNYGVFKVLDPSKFYGTVTMCGHVWGESVHGGGMVQLDIMSTDKSADGADWTNANMDLSVKDGTLRTVLALDVMTSGEVCELNSISGSIVTAGGSSSVLNMSKHNAATLKITGTRSGKYEGVLGYGDFQVAVNYGGYSENQQGTTQHHYGAIGEGSLNVIKLGDSTVQEVRRAWLNRLEVQGGKFVVNEALVAHEIASGDGKRVIVGAADPNTLYALAVGKGGILAMNTTFAEEGRKQDAWDEIKAGVDGAAYVRLEDGATISAREDWYTIKPIDFSRGASVTVNTRNYVIDPYLKAEYENGNDVFGKYERSHIIQLLGTMTGTDVKLTFNNRLIDPETAAVSTEDSSYIGYAAINDFNKFQGTENKMTVDSMTVLQVLQSNNGVEGDIDVHVEGEHATLQILDKVVTYDTNGNGKTQDSMKQYIDHLTLGANKLVPGVDDGPTTGANDPLKRPNNGQLLLGGVEVKSLAPSGTDVLKSPDMADMQILISSRHNTTELQGEVSHLHIDLTGASAKLGGAAGHRAEMKNTHIDVARSDIGHTIYHTDLRNSLVHLQEDCSVNIADMVLVAADSTISGVLVDYSAGTDSPVTGPQVAAGNTPTSKTKEVTTSVNTTVELTFADNRDVYQVGDSRILVLQADQFMGVDVTGNGLTLQLTADSKDFQSWGYWAGADYIAVQISGGSGHFLFEADNSTWNSNFEDLIDSQFVLLGADGKQMEGYWVTSAQVSADVGVKVTSYMLYFTVPEPATATLSLAALVALMGRRRRKD